jgi:transposase-like protein
MEDRIMQYTKERKEAVLKKMMPPHNRSINELAREEGISVATLYLWRRQARERGLLLPDSDRVPEGWSARDKFNAVVESAGMNEAEMAAYCRPKGLYPEQPAQWRRACETANDWDREANRRLKSEHKADAYQAVRVFGNKSTRRSKRSWRLSLSRKILCRSMPRMIT